MGKVINKDQGREPFGGHHFYQKTQGLPLRLSAPNYKALVEKVSTYRLTNGIPLGDPAKEITDYYAENWPWMVVEDFQPEKGPEDPDYTAWKAWLYAAWRRPSPKIVPRLQAKERWEKCKACRHNQPLKGQGSREAEELQKRAFIYRRGEWTPKELGFCCLHKWDISTSSVLDKPETYSASPEAKEPGCWVNEEAK